jgi:hypothetical protein
MQRSIHASDFDKMPGWFNVLNNAWKVSYPFGTRIRLNKDDLIKSARRLTGLNDFGSDFWEEPLERLIDSIKDEANLHPVGLFITKKRMVNLLSTRLKAEWWFKKEPGILEQPLYPVLLIAGLQRTGTTKLQRLLSADPDSRSLLSWEALNPAPPVKGKDNRIGFAKTSERALKYMAPGFFAIHPVEHMAQEEDILLLDVTFLSTTPEATMNVPSYAKWLENTDQTIAYSYGAKLLRLLQWQRPAKHWILKSPHHLEFYNLIDKQYGNVHFLWTHRDLKACVPSFLSMVAHGHRIFSNRVDIEKVTNHWLNKTKYMLEKAMSFRKLINTEDKFTDIHYDAFIDQPINTVLAIYEKLRIPMNQELETYLTSFEKRNSKGKYGSHQYNLHDFDITAEQIKFHYTDYLNYLLELKEK